MERTLSSSQPSLGRIAKGTMTWRLIDVVTQGDKVVVEWTSERKTSAGRHYANNLIAIFEVRNGWIVSMREYLDTQKAGEAYWPERMEARREAAAQRISSQMETGANER